jgi:hypothetical protein
MILKIFEYMNGFEGFEKFEGLVLNVQQRSLKDISHPGYMLGTDLSTKFQP